MSARTAAAKTRPSLGAPRFRAPRRVAVALLLAASSAPPLRAATPTAPQQSPPPQKSTAQAIASAEAKLRVNPRDADALEALARAQAEMKNFPAAIASYRKVVEAHPDDQGAQLQLARLLGWNRQYSDAIRVLNSLLARWPSNREALELVAALQLRSGDRPAAAVTYGKLASQYPSRTDYLFEAARLEQEQHQYAVARDRLATLLALEPANDDARLLLAQLELREGKFSSSILQFERVRARRPRDSAALMGAAQARYYTGDLARAYTEAGEVVKLEPRNFDALFLLASIERARGHRRESRTLLRRAARISHRNPEVSSLRDALWQESSTVLHLTLGYAHEAGAPSSPASPPGLIDENLHTFTFGSRFDFLWLPHTTSSLSLDALPVESFTGAPNNAVPGAFLYRQTTRLTRRLTLRGGVGVQRFGPVKPVSFNLSEAQIGAAPQPSASPAAVGFLGASVTPLSGATIDFTWSRSGITYTPVAAWLGVLRNRKELGLDFDLDEVTTLHLTYFEDSLSTEQYSHASGVNLSGPVPPFHTASDSERGSGGTLEFNRRIVGRERVTLQAGASAQLFGYNGPRRGLYLGFFTPSFYQRELFTTNLSGTISSRLGYALSTGLGVQQVDQGQPFQRALTIAPSFRLKLTPYLAATLGYTYYDSAQSLGIVSGNGFLFGLDCRF
jgi:tetratricopeptide (TPR) repeat protein